MLVAQLMNVLIKILSQFLDLILSVTLEHNLHLWSQTAMASPVLHMMMRKNSHVLFALVRQTSSDLKLTLTVCITVASLLSLPLSNCSGVKKVFGRN